jgi:drug/metabolite transporter (DMT)-like permease
MSRDAQLNSNSPSPAIYGALVALILLLSSSPAVTRLGVTKTLTSMDLVFLRCAGGALLWLPYFLKNLKSAPRKVLLTGLILAFLQGWGTHLTSVIGLQFAPAAHSSVLGPGFSAVWVAFLMLVIYGDRPQIRQRYSLGLIATGACVLLFASSSWNFNGTVFFGDLLFLTASGFGAAYMIYIQRTGLSPLFGAAMVSVYSGLIVVPYFFWTQNKSQLLQAPAIELAVQIIYQSVCVGGLFVAAIGFMVSRLGSQKFSLSIAFVPILSLCFGKLIAGDEIRLVEAAAIVLVSTGVIIGAWTRPVVPKITQR